MIFQLTIIGCVLNAIITVIAFVCYVRARMASRDEYPRATAEEHARRLAMLDNREHRYQSIHFITLFLFVLLGVLLLVQLSNRIP